MGAVYQIALDIPPEIVDGLAAGIMTRSGSVVRNSAGQIVAHLKETDVVKEQLADKIAKAARVVWKSPRGRVAVIGCTSLLAAGLWVRAKERSARKAQREQLDADYRAALTRYLDAASQAALNMDVIVGLASVAERLQEHPLQDRPVFSPQIVDLIEEHTRELAEANNVGWNPIESTDDDLFARLVYSLETQRQIFDNAA
jgi:hypothetical protein